ncbi:MAG: universal stress protein [Steroidobacteraceae bacterium]
MYNKILVPVDGSDASNRGLDEAIRIGQELNSRLKVIHVVNELFLIGSEQVYYDYNAHSRRYHRIVRTIPDGCTPYEG